MLDLKLDFNNYRTIELNTLIKKINSKERICFKIEKEEKQLKNTIKNTPKNSECFKILSIKGGFSSIAIISYIANTEKIEEMYVSTFRIGKKHFDILDELYKKGKILKATFFTSDSQKELDTDYNYYAYISENVKKNNWNIYTINNHSKIILLKTNKNYFVIETSSNLNENPKIEHFNWENDKELYKWYKDFFEGLRKELIDNG